MDPRIKTGLFAKLPKFIKEMNREELLEFFPEGTYMKEIKSGERKGEFEETPFYTKAYLMRSIVINERDFNKYGDDRTLRGMWYSSVKPTLDKLGLLEEDDMTEAGLVAWDKKLSRYVCDLLRKGYLTFSDLNITDQSRQRSNPSKLLHSGPASLCL